MHVYTSVTHTHAHTHPSHTHTHAHTHRCMENNVQHYPQHVHTHTHHTKPAQTNPIVLATALAEGRLIEQYIQEADHPVENVLRELSSPARQHPTPTD